MSKLTRSALVLAGGSVLVMGTAASATAVDYVADAVSALGSSSVYVDQSSSLNEASAIASAYDGEGVAVVALPYDAVSTYSANTLASTILARADGYDTVVVVVDGSSFGVASDGNSAAVQAALYENFSGNAGEAILASSKALTSEGETGTAVGQPPADGFSPAPLAIGGGIGLALLAAVAVWVFKNMRKPGQVKTVELPSDMPSALRLTLRKLDEQVGRYRAVGEIGLADSIAAVLNHSGELFVRVKKKSGAGQYNMAVVEYTDTFKKLEMALSDDYYYDILKNPQLWTNPEARLTEVRDAVAITDKQIIRNIQQVNSNEDLEIKVALESLSRSLESPALDTIYKDQ